MDEKTFVSFFAAAVKRLDTKEGLLNLRAFILSNLSDCSYSIVSGLLAGIDARLEEVEGRKIG